MGEDAGFGICTLHNVKLLGSSIRHFRTCGSVCCTDVCDSTICDLRIRLSGAMKLVSGLPVSLAALHLAIVGELIHTLAQPIDTRSESVDLPP